MQSIQALPVRALLSIMHRETGIALFSRLEWQLLYICLLRSGRSSSDQGAAGAQEHERHRDHERAGGDEMIAFASLFLGLVLGSRPVEIVVGQDMATSASHSVSTLEIRLDNKLVAELERPPWIAACDFGTELTPHHLEAIAFDSEGREVSRIEQWLNLPQASAVVSAILEPAGPGDGGGRIARLSWESSVGAKPKSVTAFLDGLSLPVEDAHRILLPAADSSQLHLLSVEMEFEDRVTTRIDLTFGGSYAENLSTEMTAVPIVATRRLASPRPSSKYPAGSRRMMKSCGSWRSRRKRWKSCS